MNETFHSQMEELKDFPINEADLQQDTDSLTESLDEIALMPFPNLRNKTVEFDGRSRYISAQSYDEFKEQIRITFPSLANKVYEIAIQYEDLEFIADNEDRFKAIVYTEIPEGKYYRIVLVLPMSTGSFTDINKSKLSSLQREVRTS